MSETNWCFIWSCSEVNKMITRTDPVIYKVVLLKTSAEGFLWLVVQYRVNTGHKGVGSVSFPKQS